MKKGIILGMTCLLVLCGCGKIPKLQNGQEAVITFAKDGNEKKISAEELYEELKNKMGLQAVVKLIDNYIMEKEFASYLDEAKKNAENQIKYLSEMWGGDDKLLSAIQSNTNYSSIEAYKDYLYTNYLQSHALEEYAKSLVTDKEIEKYYKDESKGDVEVYHILITPQVKDTMTSSEKKEAETKAKDKAKEVIEKLNKADKDKKLEEFKNLVKEYTEDSSTKSKDGNLGYINYGDLDSNYDELLDAVYKLKDGEYSKSVITTELGYHIVYRNASKEKEPLDKLKDKIIETLANRKLKNEKDIAVRSLKYYRELYNLKIVDSTLDRQYGIYMNSLLNQVNSSEE